MGITERTIESRFVLNISNFSANLKTVEQKLKETENRFSGFKDVGNRFGDVGKKLTLSIAVPLAAAAASVVKLGQTFDDASDDIRAGTGATGALLDKLNSDFKKVYSTVPGSAANASMAIAELNKRTNSSGKDLEDLATKELRLAQLTKGDLATQIASTTRVFGDWSIKTQDQGKALDYLYKVSQSTGIGIDRLGTLVVQYGAPLRQMGFSYEQAAAMLGKFEKEGVNTELVVGSLRIALGKMAKEGIEDPEKALTTMIKRIKEAGSAGKANALALELFGNRAGPDMAAAIREGRLDLDQLISTLKNSSETIDKATQDTMGFAEKWELLKQKAAVKLEPLGAKALEALEKTTPMVDRLIDSIGNLVQRFIDSSPAQQKFILGLIGTAAAAGPVLSVTGGIIKGIGTLKTGYTLLTTTLGIAKTATAATTAATVAGTAATGAATAATTGLGASMGAVLLPIAGVAAGIVAITVAGVALYKHLSQKAIPAVDLYGKEVSETTKNSVSAFLDLDKKATESINHLNWSGQTVSKDMAQNITSTFDTMGQQIKQGLEKHYNKDLDTMRNFFATSSTLSSDEEQKALASLQTNYQSRLKSVDDGLKRINDIYKKASDENRKTTQDEQNEIDAIHKSMTDLGIQALSEYESESKSIMERMKHEKTKIAANEAADIIKSSVKERDGVVDEANKQCDTTIARIVEMRDEAHSITSEQADLLIDEAIRQRDETIQKAKEMHQGVVDEAMRQAGEHAAAIDIETGEVKTRWQRFADWCDQNPIILRIKQELQGNFTTGSSNGGGGGGYGGFSSNSYGGFASGTEYASRGLHWLAEDGYEIVTSPQLRMFQGGEQVINHENSERVLSGNRQVNHNVSGTIKVVGVNNEDQVVAIKDILMDELRKELRT